MTNVGNLFPWRSLRLDLRRVAVRVRKDSTAPAASRFRQPRQQTAWIAALACVCLLLAGCGKSDGIVQVRGSVTVNGESVSGAQVILHPVGDEAGITASGVTGEDGTYQLMSGLEEGIRPGSYRVTVVWPDPDVQPTEQEIMMGTAERGPDLLKGKYSSRDKSELQVEIDSDTAEIPPFELTKPD